MDGDREHELMCAVARSRHLLQVLDREHHVTDVYAAARAVRFELEAMAALLPEPPPAEELARRVAVQLPLL